MCMTILVGRAASDTGEILIGHNEDAPGRFIMQTHLVGKKCRHPGTLFTFEPDLSDVELGQTRTNLFWSEAMTYSGTRKYSDSAFSDLYVNGHGVAICSNNCADSREDSPDLTDGGIGYGLRRLVAEKAHSAREAVDIACDIVERYGYASSGRSYAFADKEEIYVMQIVNGKHWAIKRVPDDEVAVIPNHYTIHEPDKNARGYDELVSYAERRGWYNHDSGDFNFARVYQSAETWGLDKNTYRHVSAFEILLDMDLSALHKEKWQGLPFSVKPSRKVSINTMKKILRSHSSNPHFPQPLTICNTETLESTIIEMRHNTDRIILRRALGQPIYSPYVVWYFGIPKVPDSYEYSDPEKAITEHFTLKPEAMDWRNNAWFRTLEINACTEMLCVEKEEAVRAEIGAFEEKEEHELLELDPQIELSLHNKPYIARAMMEGFVMKWTDNAETLSKTLRAELGIITGESLNAITEGASFMVRLHDVRTEGLDPDKCICGTSCSKYEDWSKCKCINESEGYIEFAPGDWFNDAFPCFTDLYMLLVYKSGNKRAGCVRAQVRK